MIHVEFKRCFISIHAPAKGATRGLCLLSFLVRISIHAPAKGATYPDTIQVKYYPISIHAPAKGATAKATILLRNENIYLVNTHNLLFPNSNYKYFRSGLVTFLWCESPILLMSTYHSHQFISLMYLQPHKKLCFQNVQLLSDNYFPDNKTAGCPPSH